MKPSIKLKARVFAALDSKNQLHRSIWRTMVDDVSGELSTISER
jgi:hypothetical protein